MILNQDNAIDLMNLFFIADFKTKMNSIAKWNVYDISDCNRAFEMFGYVGMYVCVCDCGCGLI